MWFVAGCDIETWPRPTQGCTADDVDDYLNINYNARCAVPQATNQQPLVTYTGSIPDLSA